MLTVNRINTQLNTRTAVNFKGGDNSLTPSSIIQLDPKAFSRVNKADYALGEQSLIGLIKDQLTSLYGVMFDPEISAKGKEIEKDLRKIVNKTNTVGSNLNIHA